MSGELPPMTLDLTPAEVLMLSQGYSNQMMEAFDAVVVAAETENWEMWDEEIGNLSFHVGRCIELLRAYRSMIEEAEVEEDG